MAIKTVHEMTDHYCDQSCFIVKVGDPKTNEVFGYLTYALYQNEIGISLIEVKEKYRRQGYATMLISEMKKQNPEITAIDYGYLTEDGSKFFKQENPLNERNGMERRIIHPKDLNRLERNNPRKKTLASRKRDAKEILSQVLNSRLGLKKLISIIEDLVGDQLIFEVTRKNGKFNIYTNNQIPGLVESEYDTDDRRLAEEYARGFLIAACLHYILPYSGSASGEGMQAYNDCF